MPPKIAILYVIHFLFGYGGTEKHLFELVKRLDKDKFMPMVCCFTGGKFLEEIKKLNVKAFELPVNRLYGLQAIKSAIRLGRIIRKENIRMVQTFHTKPDLYVPVIAKLCGVPVVISSRRDLGFNRKKIHVPLQKIINLFVDKIIVNSNAVRDMCAKQEHIASNKIVLIYNGIAEEFLRKGTQIENQRKGLQIRSSEFAVGVLSNLNPIKGIDSFINACPLVLEKIPNTKFLLIGDGPMREKLLKQVKRLGISSNVTITGNLKDIRGVLSMIDISVNSSLSEGFSNSILESMAVGKPVVATNVGGNPEAVVHGETGFLVPPRNPNALAEAIIKLVENKRLARKMGIAGRERIIEHFTLKKMIKETESLYGSLLEKKIRREGDVQRERRDVRLFFSKLIKVSLSAILYYSGLFIVIRKVPRLLPHQRGIKILAYHRVNDSGPDYLSLNTSVANFESQIRYLKRHFKIISLEEAVQLLCSNEPTSEDLFVITFDDGYKDNYINAFPILKKYKIPATIFLTLQPIEDRIPLWFENIIGIIERTSQKFLNLGSFGLGKYLLATQDTKKKAINDIITYAERLTPSARDNLLVYLSRELPIDQKLNNQMLSWDEIREMHNYGISFGSHAMTHSILTTLPLERAKYEIKRSMELLEEKLGEKISFFSYPNGSRDDFNWEIMQILKDSGFSAAFTLMNGFNDGNTELFALQRVCMTEGISVGFNGGFLEPYFASKMAGMFDISLFNFLKKKFTKTCQNARSVNGDE